MNFENFTYASPYATYKNCFFAMSKYSNGNLYLGIGSYEEGPIADCTINPGTKVPVTQLAIKDYSENKGMSEFLIKNGIIKSEPVCFACNGFINIPIYPLTDKGMKLFKEMKR